MVMGIEMNLDRAKNKLLKNLKTTLNSRYIFLSPEPLNPHECKASDKISFASEELMRMNDDELTKIIKDQFARVLFIALSSRGLDMLPEYQFAFCSEVEDDILIDRGEFILILEMYIYCK